MAEPTTIRDAETGGAAPIIPGMSEEGEKLSPEIANASQVEHNDTGELKFGTSRADRKTSYELSDFPVLTGREEEWRFTPLERMEGLDLPEGNQNLLTGQAPKVSIVDAEGISLETASRDDKRIGTAGIPDDRVAAAGWNSFGEAAIITVHGEHTEPVRVFVEGTHADLASQHIVLNIKPNAKADIVIHHTGDVRLVQNVEIIVGEGANVNIVSIQAWDNTAVHLGTHQASLHKDATFKHTLITYGGKTVRVNPTTRFADDGATANMYGLYFADEGQHLEHRTFIDHSTNNCVSDLLYKGALQGNSARTVWVGDVLIRKSAEGTDTFEKNENLLLTEGAQADSVPNLEIETGLIESGGHASSTGRFDEGQLFYLMSRGIGESQARKLIVRGFLNEIIQKIGVDDVEERLVAVMEEEISGLSL